MPSIDDKVSAIVLSGGRGSRFGHEDKGLLMWEDKTFIQHVIEHLLPQVDQLVICCNRNPDRYASLGFELFHDADPEAFLGPMAGISAAAKAITNPLCLICANDTPLLPSDLVTTLKAALIHNDCQVAYPVCGERHHYLPSLMHTESLITAFDYLTSGGRSLRGWYGQFQTCAVDFSHDAKAFSNINSPDELLALNSI